jgi:hypothetical protein
MLAAGRQACAPDSLPWILVSSLGCAVEVLSNRTLKYCDECNMSDTWDQLRTVASDGTAHTFWYSVSRPTLGDKRLTIRVARTNPPLVDEDWFEFTFVPVDQTRWRIDMIDRRDQLWARRKGIIRAALTMAARECSATIVSSRAGVDGQAEYRTIEAEAMWRGLQSARLAYYDDGERRWVFSPEILDEPQR